MKYTPVLLAAVALLAAVLACAPQVQNISLTCSSVSIEYITDPLTTAPTPFIDYVFTAYLGSESGDILGTTTFSSQANQTYTVEIPFGETLDDGTVIVVTVEYPSALVFVPSETIGVPPIPTPVFTTDVIFTGSCSGETTVIPGTGTGGGTAPAAPADPGSDRDRDGVNDFADNCPWDFNPTQADGWGTRLGDACENHYVSGEGIKGFVLKDGTISVWGACVDRFCFNLAQFHISQLNQNSDGEAFSAGFGGWEVIVYYLGTDPQNPETQVYQVNTYNNGGLIDDQFLLLIAADGTVTWATRP